ncbi:MAG TPA: nuclear transport factor 2 family protein [Thermomicrobiales bacterium]|nr:nuclear transport factor 2 family protein [Thermomicrobiales bacterium]
MVSPDTIRTTVHSYAQAVSALDAGACAALFAPDCVLYYPGQPTMRGRDAVQEYYQRVARPLTALELRGDAVFPVADGAAVKWTLHATGKNDRTAAAEGVNVFAINGESRIEWLRLYFDASVLAPLLQG